MVARSGPEHIVLGRNSRGSSGTFRSRGPIASRYRARKETAVEERAQAGRRDGRYLRPGPPRSPRGRQRGGAHLRPGRGLFVPTGQPYQKDDRKVSSAEDRYLMTVIATASNPRFSVSRVDIDRPGPTYTIDTLRELKRSERPGDRPVLHHRRGRPGEHPDLARRRRPVQPRALHRLHQAWPPAHRRGPARRQGLPGRNPGPRHIEQRVPPPRRRRRAGLVPGTRRRGPVHSQARPLRENRRLTASGVPAGQGHQNQMIPNDLGLLAASPDFGRARTADRARVTGRGHASCGAADADQRHVTFM